MDNPTVVNATVPVDLDGDLPGQTFDLHMLKPGTDTPIGWVITLAGPEHPKAMAHKDKMQREALDKAAEIERAQVNGRKYKAEALSPAEKNRNTVAWLVSRIVTWTPVRIAGQVYEFSDQAATTLLLQEKMAPYIKQIVDYLQGERAFMPASAQS